ncbi:uncharacterized protein BXZ73DRAFT_84569 [Epithele typhae]|uniref:uncharacterized protein n=1 Tax=Epithele typhae TaxID=378194 RepID=UPI0020082BF9|nr:uncharacterized protein BXZ73DRAFT_84569 [Epithele typhae]KAH9907646.1 hypothetical protein BXZ73DRAFT_84569 [Epithele typhae]
MLAIPGQVELGSRRWEAGRQTTAGRAARACPIVRNKGTGKLRSATRYSALSTTCLRKRARCAPEEKRARWRATQTPKGRNEVEVEAEGDAEGRDVEEGNVEVEMGDAETEDSEEVVVGDAEAGDAEAEDGECEGSRDDAEGRMVGEAGAGEANTGNTGEGSAGGGGGRRGQSRRRAARRWAIQTEGSAVVAETEVDDAEAKEGRYAQRAGGGGKYGGGGRRARRWATWLRAMAARMGEAGGESRWASGVQTHQNKGRGTSPRPPYPNLHAEDVRKDVLVRCGCSWQGG